MKHIKKLFVPTKAGGKRLAKHRHPATSKDVRIIRCLSPNLPQTLWGTCKPEEYIGIISSEYPKKCMIPKRAATFVTNAHLDVPNKLPELISLPGFSQMLFYPFRKLAEALGYDVLWCTFKEPGFKYYTGHVLFAEHMNMGVWIRINKKSYENLFGTTYSGHLYTGGWLYAVPTKSSNYYLVQTVNHRLLISADDIIEIVDPISKCAETT